MFFHRIKTEHFVYRNATLSIHEKECKMDYLIQKFWKNVWHWKWGKDGAMWGFCGGSVVGNPPVNTADTSLIPGPGWIHMPQKSSPCATAIEPVFYSLEAATVEPMCCNHWSLVSLESVLHKRRGHHNENPVTETTEQHPFPTTREKPIHSNESPAQQKNIYIYKQITAFRLKTKKGDIRQLFRILTKAFFRLISGIHISIKGINS